MLRTRHSVLNFDPGKQDISFMLREAERDMWGFMRGEMRRSYKEILEALLKHEQEEYLRVLPNERSRYRKGFRAGYSSLTIKTSLGTIELQRPRLRKQRYQSAILPKYTKNERHLLDMIANLYLVGVSTGKMAKGLESILGKNGISSTGVSIITNRANHRVQEFHRRPLEDKYLFLYLDGISMTIKGSDGKGRKYLLLLAYGVDHKGIKELIDFLPVRSESESNWSGFLFNLYERGLKGEKLKLIIVDGGKGLAKALDGIYIRVLRQRCWVHKLRNVSSYLRKTDEEACLGEAKGIYKAHSLRQARKRFARWKANWGRVCPKAVDCIEKDLDELLNFFLFDRKHWVKIRTTNPIERAFREFRRRTNVMGNHMPNLRSCEKIFFVLTEFINERWRTRKYLHFKEIEAIPVNLPNREIA